MKKLRPKEVKNVQVGVFLCGLVLAGLGITGTGTAVLVPLGIIVILASLLVRVVFYRCPHCATYLDRNVGAYCPTCGKNINEA